MSKHPPPPLCPATACTVSGAHPSSESSSLSEKQHKHPIVRFVRFIFVTHRNRQHPPFDFVLLCTTTHRPHPSRHPSLALPTFSWHAPWRKGMGRCPWCSGDHRACWRHMTGIWLLSASPLPGQAREAAGTWRQQLVKLARGEGACCILSHVLWHPGGHFFFLFLARKTQQPCSYCSFGCPCFPEQQMSLEFSRLSFSNVLL